MSTKTQLNTIRTIFSIDIIQSFKKVDYEALINHIETTGEIISTDKYDTRYEDTKLGEHPIIDELIDHARKCVREALDTNSEIVGEPWAHIHEKNMSTSVHNHKGTNISVVYYVQTPKGSGDIFFAPEPEFVSPTAFVPQQGGMLLFPGWLKHSVTRNTSDDKRISISFNLLFTRRTHHRT